MCIQTSAPAQPPTFCTSISYDLYICIYASVYLSVQIYKYVYLLTYIYFLYVPANSSAGRQTWLPYDKNFFCKYKRNIWKKYNLFVLEQTYVYTYIPTFRLLLQLLLVGVSSYRCFCRIIKISFLGDSCFYRSATWLISFAFCYIHYN